MRTVELLAPVGSVEALDAAVGEGADGVYLGLRSFNARMRSVNFSYPQFEAALRALHRMGRKLYVTVNTIFEQREADRLYQLLKYLAALGPDGIIVQDFGIIRMVRDYFPSLKLHASTQMNVASARGCNLLSKQGFSRVVLARELGLWEIRDIRSQTNMELEIFVHGALCVSVSGLCLFSSFLGGKSANRGLCTQACRRIYYRGEESRGGYFFSPADLQLVEYIPQLVDAGVNSIKIEGRMKSANYVGTVVAAYRRVIDALSGDREQSIQEAQDILRNDFARRKTRYFFEDSGSGDWLKADEDGGTGISLGIIHRVRGTGDHRQGFIQGDIFPEPGDSIRLHRADDSQRKVHRIRAVGAEDRGWVSIPEGFGPGDSVYLIQTKALSRRYAPVLRGTPRSRLSPGRDRAPSLSLPLPPRKSPFPEGYYAAFSRWGDLYLAQSVRPCRVMLSYTRENIARLLEDPWRPLPFPPEEIIITLDPFFPGAMEKTLEDEIPRLRMRGYRYFVLNNLGHWAYFRSDPEAVCIAGPWLYTFNRWAMAAITSLGIDAIVSPLENNRQNLERSLGEEVGRRAWTFITVFAYPPLFRIRANLGTHPAAPYAFERFRDNRNESFRLIHRDSDGSLVVPEQPFSIVDKIPFLEAAGFRRFIVDLSGPLLRKRDYRDIMEAVQERRVLPNTRRFNWKDGFYQEEGREGASEHPLPRETGVD